MAFYYRLSLLAGGVLSLSITYIGYLASLEGYKVSYAELLFLGWISLLLAIFSSIYRNHFNLGMGHWQTLNVLNKSRLEQFEAMLVMLQKYPQQFINLKTEAEVKSKISTTEESISKIKKAMKEIEDKEKHESGLWTLSQNTAHISFFAGMVLITLFASLNLPVKIDFTIVRTVSSMLRK